MPDPVPSLQTNTFSVDRRVVGETESNVTSSSLTFMLQSACAMRSLTKTTIDDHDDGKVVTF